MQDIKDKSIDLILCDLPYGTTAAHWDSVIPFDELWAHYKRIAKPNCPIVLHASQPFTSALVMSQPKLYRHGWIWVKNRGTNPFAAKYAPLKKHEDILVFGLKTPYYNPIMRNGKPYSGFSSADKQLGEVYGKSKSKHKDNPEGKLLPVSVQHFDCEFGLHPTQKSLKLVEYLVKTYSKPNGWVLDNCMGSGTTGVACVNTGRRFIGIEKEQKYFDIAVNRIKSALKIPVSVPMAKPIPGLKSLF